MPSIVGAPTMPGVRTQTLHAIEFTRSLRWGETFTSLSIHSIAVEDVARTPGIAGASIAASGFARTPDSVRASIVVEYVARTPGIAGVSMEKRLKAKAEAWRVFPGHWSTPEAQPAEEREGKGWSLSG